MKDYGRDDRGRYTPGPAEIAFAIFGPDEVVPDYSAVLAEYARIPYGDRYAIITHLDETIDTLADQPDTAEPYFRITGLDDGTLWYKVNL